MLTDRFSNIHYLMRHGRTGRMKMHWFVMTLRALFDDKEFAEAAAKAVRRSASDASARKDESLFLAQNALQCAGSEDARRMFLDRMVGSREFDDSVDVALAKKFCRLALEDNPHDAYTHQKWGRLLAVHLKRYDEAIAAYRKAIDLDPKFAPSWNGLANLLADPFCQYTEAEGAYRNAIKLDPEFANPRSGLADLLSTQNRNPSEADHLAIEGLQLAPSHAYSRSIFIKLCFTHPESLRSVLPEISHWCTQHPDDSSVLGFMVDAWIAFAKCTSSVEALALLDAQPEEVKPAFDTVRDAFLSHADNDHLHRLAPERRAPVLKLLERLTNQ